MTVIIYVITTTHILLLYNASVICIVLCMKTVAESLYNKSVKNIIIELVRFIS